MHFYGFSEFIVAENDGGIALAECALILANLSVLQHTDASRLHETDT